METIGKLSNKLRISETNSLTISDLQKKTDDDQLSLLKKKKSNVYRRYIQIGVKE